MSEQAIQVNSKPRIKHNYLKPKTQGNYSSLFFFFIFSFRSLFCRLLFSCWSLCFCTFRYGTELACNIWSRAKWIANKFAFFRSFERAIIFVWSTIKLITIWFVAISFFCSVLPTLYVMTMTITLLYLFLLRMTVFQ